LVLLDVWGFIMGFIIRDDLKFSPSLLAIQYKLELLKKQAQIKICSWISHEACNKKISFAIDEKCGPRVSIRFHHISTFCGFLPTNKAMFF